MSHMIRCSNCLGLFDYEDRRVYYDGRPYLWCKTCFEALPPDPEPAARPRARKKPRARVKSSDPLESRFIRMRRGLVARHERGEYLGAPVSTTQLLELHRRQQGRCHYTGLRYSLDERGPLYMTVDRLDSSMGYVPGNVVLCCWFVNCAKNEWPIDQMMRLWAYLPTVD